MTYVILAAGSSSRMGFAKVFTPLGTGGPPLERIARLLHGRRCVVVVPPDRLDDARSMAPAARVVANGEPERGMAHSLRLALGEIAVGEDFAVMLGDKPFLRAETLDALEGELRDADVAYPVASDSTPGHPVLFAAIARERALHLPDGDAIFTLRDDPALRSRRVRIDDPGAFADLDAPSEWEAAADA